MKSPAPIIRTFPPSYSQSYSLYFVLLIIFVLFAIPTLQNIHTQMQELTPQQYEITLKYMETTNQDNFQLAASTLKQHDFNLEHAINSKFNPSSRNPSNRNQRPQQNDQEVIRKYIEFVQRKNAEWSPIEALFGLVKGLLFAILGFLSKLLPSKARLRLIGSDFEKLYSRSLPNTFSSKSLASLLKLTGNLSSKSVLVLISPPKSSPEILNFMNNPELQKTISRNFYLTGHVIGNVELVTINEIQAPMLVALRRNLFQEIKQVGRTRQLQKVDTNLLNVWAHESKNLFKRDGNVLIKYRNFVNRMYGNFYEEEEQQEVNLNHLQLQRQQIKQQNKAYQEMLEQTKKEKHLQVERKVKEQEEKRLKEEIQMQRQMRKSSIPQEPTQGDIVRLSFRCPDGSTIIRNFSFDQKLDVVYHWVQLNENISFEDEHRRSFELMHSYPPQPLSSRRENLLKEIFDSSQEKLVIREL